MTDCISTKPVKTIFRVWSLYRYLVHGQTYILIKPSNLSIGLDLHLPDVVCVVGSHVAVLLEHLLHSAQRLNSKNRFKIFKFFISTKKFAPAIEYTISYQDPAMPRPELRIRIGSGLRIRIKAGQKCSPKNEKWRNFMLESPSPNSATDWVWIRIQQDT